jgi:hypothetical protein
VPHANVTVTRNPRAPDPSPVVLDPGQRPLHHPPSRQHQVAFGRQQVPPIHRHALFGPFPRPPHQHLFRGGLSRTLYEIHAPVQGLPDPVRALGLCALARVQPQVGEAGKPLVGTPKQRLDLLVVQHLGAVNFSLFYAGAYFPVWQRRRISMLVLSVRSRSVATHDSARNLNLLRDDALADRSTLTHRADCYDNAG